MTTRWVDVFLDRPRADVDAAASFWAHVVDGTPSPWRAGHTFTTLLPPDGDAYLRLQAVDRPEPRSGCHLDLQVADPAREAERLGGVGAAVVSDEPGLVVLRSPAGLTFCLTPSADPPARWRPGPAGAPASRVDQVTLDLPGSVFEPEREFWAAVTGWEQIGGSSGEFHVLRAPGWGSAPPEPGDGRQAGPPVRLLLQRLEEAVGPAGLHVDLACADRDATVAEHVGIGARVVGQGRRWTVLHDPTGATYCLTDRDPQTGLLPA